LWIFTFGASASYSREQAAQAHRLPESGEPHEELILKHRRPREAYGVPSGVNNILVVNKVTVPGRITTILVKESLGI